ncbi:MAG: hypothetical protein WCF78_04730 [archaeon]
MKKVKNNTRTPQSRTASKDASSKTLKKPLKKNTMNYLDNTKAILGPYIKDHRWYCIKQREMTEMKVVLLNFLPDNCELNTDIFVGQEIRNLYLIKTEVLEFLSDFFIPKERFLV